jgi:preprotein translocase subunit SecA
MLGGSIEFLADEELRGRGLDPVEHSDEYEAAWPATLDKIKEQVEAEHDEVNDVGGLYVIGTERHESRRIDNQLRGRSGRQGDPGESRFYLSLQDDLMRLFKSDWVDWVLTTMKIPDDVPIENKRVTGAIASAQAQVESQNFETRKNILKYDDVMSRQREVIYAERRQVLEGADLHEQIEGMIDDTIAGYVAGATEGFPEDWDLEQLWTALRTLHPVSLTIDQVVEEAGGVEGLDRDVLEAELRADAHAAYTAREETLGSEVLRELERRVLLSVLDRKWREHLYEMDYLREGIGLRAYSQRDPLVEYQREGFELFTAMMDSIKEESVGFLFNVEVQAEPAEPSGGLDDGSDGVLLAEPVPASALEQRPNITTKGLSEPSGPRHLSYSAPTVDGDAGAEDGQPAQTSAPGQDDEFAGVGRNALCPCGSGRKFKRCHGDPARRSA